MPRIYVASLSDYNSGRLHGEWIDLEGLDLDDVQAEIQTMLSESPIVLAGCVTCGVSELNHAEVMADLPPDSIRHEFIRFGLAEEYAIHDYEGFGDYKVHEYESLETLVAIADAMNEHSPEAVAAWVEHYGTADIVETVGKFCDAYMGEYESGAKYAEEHVYEMWEAEHGHTDYPSFLSYIDWDRYWYGEFQCGGMFITDQGHVFDGNV